jgi:hypothetical protein
MPLVILHGSNEQLSSGKGEVVITAAQAASRLGVSSSRIRQMVLSRQLQPLNERFHGADLFPEAQVERLKALREGLLREAGR